MLSGFPQLRVGDPVQMNNLRLYPLFSDDPAQADYELSEVALASGHALVEEVTESGSVPQLSVKVLGELPVLFLEGEELRGAKQNRVLNTTVLVAAKSDWKLPVSCVEQGRWRYASKHFGHSGSHASPKLRHILKKSVSDTVRKSGMHTSDQGAVWSEVSRQMSSTGSSSATMAMSDCFDTHRETLQNYAEVMKYVPGAVGLAAAIGGVIVSLDLFESAQTCEKVWPRVLTGLGMESLENQDTDREPDLQSALEVFQIGPWDEAKAAGLGEEFRATDPDQQYQGSALFYNGRLLHASMTFSTEPEALPV
jgi:hypothetical protein